MQAEVGSSVFELGKDNHHFIMIVHGFVKKVDVGPIALSKIGHSKELFYGWYSAGAGSEKCG